MIGTTNVALSILVANLAGTPTPFSEEAVARGISETHQGPQPYQIVDGFGMAFADLDDDGDPDLVTTGRLDGVIGVYENQGNGFFTDLNVPAPILPVPSLATSVSAADYDADGDLDLFVNVWNDQDMLLRNDGGFVFVDVTADALILDTGPSLGSSWGDVDGDGYLDVYVPHRTHSAMPPPPFSTRSTHLNRLWQNNGDGTFTDIGPGVNVVPSDLMTLQSCFFDCDRDGDQDLMLANDKGPRNCAEYHTKLYRNDGGTFTDISVAAGVDRCMDGMCVAIGDVDGNLYDDVFVTDLATLGHELFQNLDGALFSRSGVSSGTAALGLGWGAVFLDYDNSGTPDLFVCQDNFPNRFFVNDGSFPLSEMSAPLGLDLTARTYCVASADIDDDGDIDLAVSDVGGRFRLYINNEGQQRNWVKLRIRGRDANTHAIGAIVDLRTGSTWQTRQIVAGSNFKSQNDLTVHFGLDGATVVDEIVVSWPGGESRTFADVAPNQTHELSLFCACDLNEDDLKDIGDLLVFLGAWFAPASDPDTADFDGNGTAGDINDLLAFLACWFPETCD